MEDLRREMGHALLEAAVGARLAALRRLPRGHGGRGGACGGRGAARCWRRRWARGWPPYGASTGRTAAAWRTRWARWSWFSTAGPRRGGTPPRTGGGGAGG